MTANPNPASRILVQRDGDRVILHPVILVGTGADPTGEPIVLTVAAAQDLVGALAASGFVYRTHLKFVREISD